MKEDILETIMQELRQKEKILFEYLKKIAGHPSAANVILLSILMSQINANKSNFTLRKTRVDELLKDTPEFIEPSKEDEEDAKKHIDSLLKEIEYFGKALIADYVLFVKDYKNINSC